MSALPEPPTVLLAVDGAPASVRASEFLESRHGAGVGTNVIVLNVQTPPVNAWPDASMDLRSVQAVLLEAGDRVAEAAASRLRAAGLQALPVVRLGIASEEILDTARSSGAGMIVMGTRGHGLMSGFALGSVALRVAQGSPVPVCLLQPHTQLPAQFGRGLRVMLAADGSEPALNAAKALASWRSWLGKLEVHLQFVQPSLTLFEALMPPHDDVVATWGASAAASATQPARNLLAAAGIDTQLHVDAGDVASEILQSASRSQCDLLVLGTRGLGAAHHAFIGSVALKVAARATMPVLLVR